MNHTRASHLLAMFLPLFAILACDPKEKDDQKDTDISGDDTYVAPTDADGDGVTEADGDCDDSDPDRYPGRTEECNGIDDNCNGLVDEGWPDTDADGTADCQDRETCDGLDNDGDGLIDEDFGDEDGDGLADCLDAEDCDGLDNDGDGLIDEGYDADKDGYTQCGSATRPADCNDKLNNVHPGAAERPTDSLDNDCDGLIDEGLWANGDIIVNEIMNNPLAVNDGEGEWFEIYNNTDRTIYLNGLVITSSLSTDYHKVDSVAPIPLASHAFFVFGINGNPSRNGNVDVGYVYTDVSLSNEIDDLILEADGIVLDVISWDDGATMPDPSGASMNLDAWALGPEWADDPSSWCASSSQWTATSDRGTPNFTNDLCPNTDHDHDGYSGDDGDCNDLDPSIYPGAPEIDNTVDHDCDGILNTMPNAVADYVEETATLSTCSALQLDGTASSDPEGTALNYEWVLTSAPATSVRTTSDIQTATMAMPFFYPDVAGNYTFTLTVDDGDDDSYPSSVTVTIVDRLTEVPPEADAGDDQSAGSNSTCRSSAYGTSWTCDDCSGVSFTLDGTGSFDGDADELTYQWVVTDGSSYGSLSGSSSETATFTFSALSATYGSTNTATVTISLQVTDCPGLSDTDTVTLTFSCTGV